MIEEKRKKFPKWLLLVIIAVVALCLIGSVICLLLGGLGLITQRSGTDSPISEVISDVENIFRADTPTPTATATATSTATPTSTPTPTVTPTLGIGSLRNNLFDDALMVYIPEGEFLMGSESADADDEEAPEHYVLLDAYWIYQNEVTNAQFAEFVAATNYTTQAELAGVSRVKIEGTFEDAFGAYWEAPKGPGSTIEGMDNYPVIHVSWEDAQAYCAWAGGRLPTEAEWEKAARGEDERTYPWGEAEPDSRLANFDTDMLVAVGSFPAGASPYGLYDMAGNVWEWVVDWYDADYYSVSPYANPLGPSTGTERVMRGGCIGNTAWRLRTTTRFTHEPEYTGDFLGFRCVVDVMP